MTVSNPKIDRLDCATYHIPTDGSEADGTLDWTATTLIVVTLNAAGVEGVGYTYCNAAAGQVVRSLCEHIVGKNALDTVSITRQLKAQVRNDGRSGIAACAISAIDLALWDLKARIVDLPLCMLLGRARKVVEIYGSGGFTNYSDEQLADQLSSWTERDGCKAVKMKVGSEPLRDRARIAIARRAIGNAELFIDANGAFTPAQAVRYAGKLQEFSIRWFEEPVSSDDVRGLNFVRNHISDPIEIAAGEYVFTTDDALHLLQAGAVDVLQADVTRCGGVSGFLQIAALCEPFHTDLSGHCAPSAHLHVAASVGRLRHLEWFHDHVRIEQMLFDGAPVARGGKIVPDLSQAGLGLTLKTADAERFRV